MCDMARAVTLLRTGQSAHQQEVLQGGVERSETVGPAAYFQYAPCFLQSPPVLLHLLHVNLSPRSEVPGLLLQLGQTVTVVPHFRHFSYVATSDLLGPFGGAAFPAHLGVCLVDRGRCGREGTHVVA